MMKRQLLFTIVFLAACSQTSELNRMNHTTLNAAPGIVSEEYIINYQNPNELDLLFKEDQTIAYFSTENLSSTLIEKTIWLSPTFVAIEEAYNDQTFISYFEIHNDTIYVLLSEQSEDTIRTVEDLQSLSNKTIYFEPHQIHADGWNFSPVNRSMILNGITYEYVKKLVHTDTQFVDYLSPGYGAIQKIRKVDGQFVTFQLQRLDYQ
jgi:hypothetical protein